MEVLGMLIDPPAGTWERRLRDILCGVAENIIFDPKHANKIRQLLSDFITGLPEAKDKLNEFEFCEKLIKEILALK
jgi:hypothetical protein